MPGDGASRWTKRSCLAASAALLTCLCAVPAGARAPRPAIAADGPTLYRAGLVDVWPATSMPLTLDSPRFTVSVRTGATGRLVSWPADDPWLTLDRGGDGGIRLIAGPDRLSASGPGSAIAAVLDGARGRLELYVDGRLRDARHRAPFVIPPGGALGIGPAAGPIAELAAWPDALTPDRLLDHHLTAEGRRPPPMPPAIELALRRARGGARMGCPQIAPDGRWLAGCLSGALMLFDRATGQPSGRLGASAAPLTAVGIDPTGRFIAAADGGPTARVWRAATRRVEQRIELPHPVVGLSFSPDGRWLAAWSGLAPPARLSWIPFYAPAAEPRTIPLPGPPHATAWSPDGVTLALALDAHPPHISRPPVEPSGVPSLASLPLPPATALAWHPTDPALYTGTTDGAIWRYDRGGAHAVVSPPSHPADDTPSGLPAFFGRAHAESPWQLWPGWATIGQPIWRPPSDPRAIVALTVDDRRVAAAHGAGVRLLDHDGGSPRRLPHPVAATAVVSTARVLLTGAADGRVRRYAATDGRPMGTIEDPGGGGAHPWPVRSLRPTPDGAAVAVERLGEWRTTLVPTLGPAPPPLPSTSAPWQRLAVDATGLRLLVAQAGGELVGWDLHRLRRLDGFRIESPATAVLWTAEGPVTGHADGAITRWQPGGRRKTRVEAHAAGARFRTGGADLPTGGVDGLFELPDGTWVSTGRQTVRRWRAGQPVATHRLPSPSLQFTPPALDENGRVVVSTMQGLIRVDARTGAVDHLTPAAGDMAGAPYFRVAAVARSVAAVRAGAGGMQLTIWRDGAPHAAAMPPDLVPQRLLFTPDGDRLVVAATRRAAVDATASLLLFDAATGALLDRAEGPRRSVAAARFAPDPEGGRHRLHIGAWDGHRRVYAVGPDGLALAAVHEGCPATALWIGRGRVALCTDHIRVERDAGHLMLLDDADGEWLIADDTGDFAASTRGDRLAAAVVGPRRLGLDRVALLRNRPDRIARRFGLGDEVLRVDLERRVARRRQRHGARPAPPLMALPRVDLAPPTVTGGVAAIRGTARAAAGLSRWRLRVDGTPVADGPLGGAVDRFDARAPLTDGRNRIEVDVADAAGRWSPRAVAYAVHHDPRPPRLFVVAFGVSRYADPAIRDLRFAHQDALDLVARLRRTPADAFAEVIARAWVDEAVGAAAFAEADGLLADAAPGDTVIIFVSGHGLYDRDGVYRYLTHDTRLAAVEQAPPFERIEALLDATPARRRLLLLDTCQSGELYPDEAVVAPAPEARGQMRARVLPGGARLIRPVAAAAEVGDRRDRFVDRDLRRGRGAVVFSSSRGAEASWELDALENGAFTEALLDGFAGGADPASDGDITIDALRAFVTAEVSRRTGDRQHPTIDRENRAARITLPVIPAADH